jgi:acetylornithine deacetylase
VSQCRKRCRDVSTSLTPTGDWANISSAMIETEREAVLGYIDRAVVAQTAMDLTNIFSPTGEEGGVGEWIYRRLKEMGLRSKLQPVTPGRNNVIGVLEGDGSGPTLIFNGHMDISYTGAETASPGGDSTFAQSAPLPGGYLPSGYVVDDKWIFGSGVMNMKSALAAFLHAVDALRKARVQLRGDLVFTAVVGEIEKAAVDDYQGERYQGCGFGAKYLVSHGITGDAAIIGEPSFLQLCTAHAGVVWAKLTTRGTMSHIAFASKAVNAIYEMLPVIEAVQTWAKGYRQRNAFMGVEPGVNVTSIQGGWPWRAGRSPIYCNLVIDVRLTPQQRIPDVQHELRRLVSQLRESGHAVELELLVTAPAHAVDPSTPIASDLRAAHRAVTGSEPSVSYEGWTSDAPHFAHYGIPTVIYGPGGRMLTGGKGVKPDWVSLGVGDGEFQNMDDLVTATKVYALSALAFCGRKRVESMPSQSA